MYMYIYIYIYIYRPEVHRRRLLAALDAHLAHGRAGEPHARDARLAAELEEDLLREETGGEPAGRVAAVDDVLRRVLSVEAGDHQHLAPGRPRRNVEHGAWRGALSAAWEPLKTLSTTRWGGSCARHEPKWLRAHSAQAPRYCRVEALPNQPNMTHNNIHTYIYLSIYLYIYIYMLCVCMCMRCMCLCVCVHNIYIYIYIMYCIFFMFYCLLFVCSLCFPFIYIYYTCGKCSRLGQGAGGYR